MASPTPTPGSSKSGLLPRLGISALILVAAGFFAAGLNVGGTVLIVATVIGAYMAMNIGANDVANNVGPAIGSGALTLLGAIILAGLCEAGGAILAGGDVVGTVKGDIIDPLAIGDPKTFITLMMAALLAGAVWLNLATAIGAPVSTTHSIVGGVLGAGIAAGGWSVANWPKMGGIAASWVISPVLGGLIAAGFLFLIKHTITYQGDMRAAARRMVPILTALMTWAFTAYICTKGLKKIVKIDMGTALLIGVGTGFLAWFLIRPLCSRVAAKINNDKPGVNKLFTVPLICSAALLSFAHGANDVANAVGPLAAIYDGLSASAVSEEASIPLWIMVVGAIGIAAGLSLYGPRLIKTVGSEITELDQMRAFCIAMSAAVTVLIASHLGLPVSSTHIAVGGVFGVGFLREILKARYTGIITEIEQHHQGRDRAEVESFLEKFDEACLKDQGAMLREMKQQARDNPPGLLSLEERQALRQRYKKELVHRSILMRIVAAWIITVPAAGTLSAGVFFVIRNWM